jgi:zinc transport system permease protein
VLVTNFAPGGSTSTLLSYLFGSISNVSQQDIYAIGGLVAIVIGVLVVFGRELFVLCQDEEVARASGLPVQFLSMLLAVTAALTIVVAMRVVGLLLVSALMVVPVAAAQQVTRGFKVTIGLAMVFGVLSAVGGLTGSYQFSEGETNISPGPAIVMVALALFILASIAGWITRRSRSARPVGSGAEVRT